MNTPPSVQDRIRALQGLGVLRDLDAATLRTLLGLDFEERQRYVHEKIAPRWRNERPDGLRPLPPSPEEIVERISHNFDLLPARLGDQVSSVGLDAILAGQRAMQNLGVATLLAVALDEHPYEHATVVGAEAVARACEDGPVIFVVPHLGYPKSIPWLFLSMDLDLAIFSQVGTSPFPGVIPSLSASAAIHGLRHLLKGGAVAWQPDARPSDHSAVPRDFLGFSWPSSRFVDHATRRCKPEVFTLAATTPACPGVGPRFEFEHVPRIDDVTDCIYAQAERLILSALPQWSLWRYVDTLASYPCWAPTQFRVMDAGGG